MPWFLLLTTCLLVLTTANKPSKLESLYESSDPTILWPPEANIIIRSIWRTAMIMLASHKINSVIIT